MLIKEGASINQADGQGKSPLYWAALNDDINEAMQLATVLLDAGSNINQMASDGRTPLVAAFIKSQSNSDALSMVRFLLDKGASPDASVDGMPLLYIVITQAEEDLAEKIVTLLLEKNVSLDVMLPILGPVILLSTIEKGYLSIVKMLQKAGCNINAMTDQSVEGEEVKASPLDFALMHDQMTIAKYLLKSGGKLGSRGESAHDKDVINELMH